jgi:hypothetical protein
VACAAAELLLRWPLHRTISHCAFPKSGSSFVLLHAGVLLLLSTAPTGPISSFMRCWSLLPCPLLLLLLQA